MRIIQKNEKLKIQERGRVLQEQCLWIEAAPVSIEWHAEYVGTVTGCLVDLVVKYARLYFLSKVKRKIARH